MRVARKNGDIQGNAIVIAKSLISVKASKPKIAFNSLMAPWFFVSISKSIFSMMALILATQS